MPTFDAIYNLHGSGTTPSNVFTSTTSDYSDDEIDFGAYAAGTASPYIPQFPSRIEGAYSFPPEVPANGGVQMGVHLVIAAAVVAGSMTSATVNVTTSAASASTAIICSQNFTTTQLAQAGAHFFIPVDGVQVNRYLRCNFVANTSVASSGTAFAWYGPKGGGEQ